jgi:hypothetical protein
MPPGRDQDSLILDAKSRQSGRSWSLGQVSDARSQTRPSRSMPCCTQVLCDFWPGWWADTARVRDVRLQDAAKIPLYRTCQTWRTAG